MTQDDMVKVARECGIGLAYGRESIERFYTFVAAAEREKVARWMISKSYATGHGDTVEDLLKELEWQVAEREREACAKICDGWASYGVPAVAAAAQAIRARGEV